MSGNSELKPQQKQSQKHYTGNIGNLEFYSKDTGIGIPKDRHEAIFDRFVKADIENK